MASFGYISGIGLVLQFGYKFTSLELATVSLNAFGSQEDDAAFLKAVPHFGIDLMYTSERERERERERVSE